MCIGMYVYSFITTNIRTLEEGVFDDIFSYFSSKSNAVTPHLKIREYLVIIRDNFC